MPVRTPAAAFSKAPPAETGGRVSAKLLAGQEREYFDESEVWSPERVHEIQMRKLRQIVRHAYATLPFYRRHWQAAGLDWRVIDHLEDSSQLPIVRKDDVLRAMAHSKGSIGIESEGVLEDGCHILTSGTLGTTFLAHPWAWVHQQGDRIVRAYWWTKLRPGMRMMVTLLAWHTLAIVEAYVARRMGVTVIVPWGTVHPHFAGNVLEAVVRQRPDFISIPTHMLSSVLAEVERRGIPPRDAFKGVSFIMLGGSPVTPFYRQKLVRDLGVQDVYDGAGNPEGLKAVECSYHNGLHVLVDLSYVEVIDPATQRPLPPGVRGNLVVTFLLPHGSLFIRFDTEDVGEVLRGACPCGRTWPRLRIYGRRSEVMRVAGKDLYPYDVRLCLDQVDSVAGRPFAFIEDKRQQTLRIALQRPAQGGVAETERQATAVLRQQLGVAAGIEWVPSLRSSKTVQVFRDWKGSYGQD